MKVKVAAKLNLSLNVRPPKNNMHPLDSVAVSVDLFDTVEVVLREDREIVAGNVPFVEAEHNSAYRAAVAFRKAFDTRGCNITIEKGIPQGAGLGGSSADAAAVIYCMSRLNGIDVTCDKVADVCASVGSDVNFMLTGGLGRMTGRGEITEFFPFDGILYFALTQFDRQMSTAEVFGRFDRVPLQTRFSDNDRLISNIMSGNIAEVLLDNANFLTDAVRDISHYAEDYLSFCQSKGLKTVMTGSGSAFYILCADKESAEEICSLLQSVGYMSRVCRSVKHSVWEE